MSRKDLWEKKVQYLFSVSPHGIGLDCHRTWEDLLLGCIVIVKTSSLDPLYEGLPVVIVKDWNEISSANLNKWKNQYIPLLYTKKYVEKLTLKWWIDMINDKTNTALKIKNNLI